MLSQVHLPTSAAEAADLLRTGGWLIGGGTVVMPRVNTGAVPVDRLVSLSRAGLAGITIDGLPTSESSDLLGGKAAGGNESSALLGEDAADGNVSGALADAAAAGGDESGALASGDAADGGKSSALAKARAAGNWESGALVSGSAVGRGESGAHIGGDAADGDESGALADGAAAGSGESGALPPDAAAGAGGAHASTGGTVSVGAATTLGAVGADERLAFLHPVIRSIASPPVRNLATVGGNLLVDQPYGDLAVALLALDARIDVVGSGGNREVAVGEPIGPAEVLTAVHFELPAGIWCYRKAMRRRHNSASIVTVAAVLEVEDGVVTHARIALGGVGPRPVRALAAERALIGGPLDRPAVEAAAEAAKEGIEPFDDAYASAWYRTRVLPVHVRRALLGEQR